MVDNISNPFTIPVFNKCLFFVLLYDTSNPYGQQFNLGHCRIWLSIYTCPKLNNWSSCISHFTQLIFVHPLNTLNRFSVFHSAYGKSFYFLDNSLKGSPPSHNLPRFFWGGILNCLQLFRNLHLERKHFGGGNVVSVRTWRWRPSDSFFRSFRH